MTPADSLRLLLLSSLWGMSFIFMRVAVPEFGPVPLILVRMGLAALLLIPLLLSVRYLRLVWEHKGALLLLGLVNHVLPFTLLALATTRLEAGFTSLINATTPIFTALLGALFFATPVLRQQYLGLAMAFFGVYVLSANRLDFTLGGTAGSFSRCSAPPSAMAWQATTPRPISPTCPCGCWRRAAPPCPR